MPYVTRAVLLLLLSLSFAAPAYAQEPPAALTADWSISGEPSQRLGELVAAAGDVNGDGYADVAVSTNSDVNIYPGGANGLVQDQDHSVRQHLGSSVFVHAIGHAGDINGDGFADLVLGSPYEQVEEVNSTGRVRILYGAQTDFYQNLDVFTGDSMGRQMGYAVTAAGDLNGDGYPDAAFSAPGQYNGAAGGEVHVLLGGSERASRANTAVLVSPEDQNRFGESLSSAGDVNSDGFDDLLVGGGSAQAAYIYFGSETGVGERPDVALRGARYDYVVGRTVAGLGDVNGDGHDDVAVAAANIDDTVVAHIYYGSSDGPFSTADASISIPYSNSRPDGIVSAAGDVNGDGFADLLFSVVDELSESEPGMVYLYMGGPDGIGMNPAATATDGVAGSGFGLSVSSAGDVDGDGLDDLIVGAPRAQERGGVAYVYYGQNMTGRDAESTPDSGPLVAPDKLLDSYKFRGDFTVEEYDAGIYFTEESYNLTGAYSTADNDFGFDQVFVFSSPQREGELYGIFFVGDEQTVIERGETVPYDRTDPFVPEPLEIFQIPLNILLNHFSLDHARSLGQEQINGLTSHHYTLDAGDFVELVSNELGEEVPDAPSHTDIEVWIAEDGYLAQFSIGAHVDDLFLTWTWEVLEPNEPVEIAVENGLQSYVEPSRPGRTADRATGQAPFIQASEVFNSYLYEAGIFVSQRTDSGREDLGAEIYGAYQATDRTFGADEFYAIQLGAQPVFVETYLIGGDAVTVVREEVGSIDRTITEVTTENRESYAAPEPIQVLSAVADAIVAGYSPESATEEGQETVWGISTTEYRVEGPDAVPLFLAIAEAFGEDPAIADMEEAEISFWIGDETGVLIAFEVYMLVQEDDTVIEVELGWELEGTDEAFSVRPPPDVLEQLRESQQPSAGSADTPAQESPTHTPMPTPTPTATATSAPTAVPTPTPTSTATPLPTATAEPTTKTAATSTGTMLADPRDLLSSFEAHAQQLRTYTLADGSTIDQTLELKTRFGTADNDYGNNVYMEARVAGPEYAHFRVYHVDDRTVARLEVDVEGIKGSNWLTLDRAQEFILLKEAPALIDEILSIGFDREQAQSVGLEVVSGKPALHYRLSDPVLLQESNLITDDDAEVTSARIDVWVAVPDSYPVKMLITMEVANVTIPGRGDEERATRSATLEYMLVETADPVEIAIPPDAPDTNLLTVPGFAAGDFPMMEGAIGVTLGEMTWLQIDEMAGRVNRFYAREMQDAGWTILRNSFVAIEFEKDDLQLEMLVIPNLEGEGTIILVGRPEIVEF